MHCGSAHFFAREFYAGAVLLLGELWLLVTLLGEDGSNAAIAFGALAMVTTFDLVDGLLGLRRLREGRVRKPIVQVGVAVLLVVVSVLAAITSFGF